MKKALFNNLLVTPEEFHNRAGKNWKSTGANPICARCLRDVDPYGAFSMKVTSRFDHEDGITDCPESSTASPRYAQLRATDIDPSLGKPFKADFMKNHSKNTKKFLSYFIGASIYNQQLHNAMLDEADRINIWAYKDIKYWVIPYTLLLLIDFEGKSSSSTFKFQFNLLKTKATPFDSIWLDSNKVKLQKVYVPSGKLVKFPDGNPYVISEAEFLRITHD